MTEAAEQNQMPTFIGPAGGPLSGLRAQYWGFRKVRKVGTMGISRRATRERALYNSSGGIEHFNVAVRMV